MGDPAGEGKHLVVYITTPREIAAGLSRQLVEEKLVACANIIEQVRSIYRWKGKICDEPEALLVLKTRRELFEAMRQRVVELHPYDVPEVIALPMVAAHMPYAAWIDEVTR
ncbi:MAG: divalent-cation tolerance protein CutA [Deltaproteobacteria bacterium]|nr:divalent-cation tolerance protein CutA [Deltaproteobacteria bacterium]